MQDSVNLAGPINQLGYGVACLNIVKFSEMSGKQLAWQPIGSPDIKDYDMPWIIPALQRGRFFNPKLPSVRMYHQFDLALHCGNPRIGYPIFELDTFDETEQHHLSNQDQLFVCSKWAQTILEKNRIKTPSVVVPLGVDRSIFHEKIPTNRTSEATVFFNVGKWEIRKGHDVIIDAFEKAFTTKDNVRLVMCCVNPFLDSHIQDEWVSRYKNSVLGNKIDVLTQRLATQHQLAQLIAHADVGLFPARAEGWNLDLLEAMSCGKHVITTNATAHTEFVNSENAALISVSDLEPAFDHKWFRGQGNWFSLGESQIEQMVTHMRHYHQLKQEGKLGLNVAGLATANKFTWYNTVSTFWSNLGG
jgi:hypothetical protein